MVMFDSCVDARKLPATVFYVVNQHPKVTTISRQFSLDFPFAYDPLQATALFRTAPEDFQVDEVLGFPFSGEGEHLCLHVEKRGENTRWVAQLLAQFFDVEEVAIGYCGLKDRRAVTRQWFSVHLPNTPKVSLPLVAEYQVLDSCRHNKKLRRGMHKANSFVIRLRQVQGNVEALNVRLQQIAEQGVPNYFGEQRFGIKGGNLPEADRLLRMQYGADRKRGRKKSRAPRGGIYLSAARSYLFNLVLGEQIRRGNWQDFMMEDGLSVSSQATGPLWGRGRSSEPEAVRELEQSVLSEWQEWTNALEFSGLQQERRPLVLHPEAFNWQWLKPISEGEVGVSSDLELSFSLSSGSYATSVLRELLQLQSPAVVVNPESPPSVVI